ncbi:MAG: hypothetical protein IJU45_04485 [Clostridia bacterium]|nr:hypothetical protein [Clostridia bacterium]
MLLIKSHGRYSDFDTLKKTIIRCGKALFINGYVPDGFDELKFNAHILPLRMLVKTAAEYFKLLPKASQKIVVSVFDKTGCACDETEQLCRYVRSVRVITDNIKAYEKCAEVVYKSCGACLLVSGIKYTANKSDVIITANDTPIGDIEFKKAVVYKKYTENTNIYELNECRKTVEIPELNYVKIENFTLMCALNEECGYKLNPIPVFYGAEVFKKA